MRRLLTSFLLIAAGVLAPATTYAQQSFNLQLGGFVPHGEDARPIDDVLRNNLDFLVFDLSDFSTFNINGEWEFPLNDKISGSLGLGFNTSSEPSVYLNYVEDNHTEIEQELKLRIVPYTAVLYDLTGGTWVYVHSDPMAFVRQAIKIDTIKGNNVYLSDGPSLGTKVLAAAVPQVFGTEKGVGH